MSSNEVLQDEASNRQNFAGRSVSVKGPPDKMSPVEMTARTYMSNSQTGRLTVAGSFAVGNFAEVSFAVVNFAARKCRRKEMSPYRNFAVGNFALRIFPRAEISPYKIIRSMEISQSKLSDG